MIEPTRTSSSPEPLTEPEAPKGYLVRHNETIVGVFDNQNDAEDARKGYEMQHNINLGDNVGILKLV